MDRTQATTTGMSPIIEALARVGARLQHGRPTARNSRPQTTSASGRDRNGKRVARSSADKKAGDVVLSAALNVTCRKCSDLGYVRADVPVGHPDFGRAMRCSYKAVEDRANLASRAQQASNLKGRLLTKTFATFDCSRSPEASEACAVWRAFAEKPEGWVLLLGTRGTGKTHLLAAVANALMGSGMGPSRSPLYVVVPDFLDYVRADYESNRPNETASRRMEDARNCPVLLLDDLGVEKRTLWTDEQMYRLLNHRYNEGLPTVIASNVEMEELEPRIASRMQDSSLARMVVLAGEDQRIASGKGSRR
jgi:DNA replication protein DnaC